MRTGLYARVGLMVFLRQHPELVLIRLRANTERLMRWYRI